MKRVYPILAILLAFALTACATNAATQPPPPTDTPASSSASGANSTSAPAAASSTGPTSGKVAYKIVSGESQASYTVNETLFNQNNRINTAVGVTHTVSGEIDADLTTPANTTIGPITIDVSQSSLTAGSATTSSSASFSNRTSTPPLPSSPRPSPACRLLTPMAPLHLPDQRRPDRAQPLHSRPPGR